MTTFPLSIRPSKTTGEKLSIKPLDLCQYNYEDFFSRTDQVKGPNFHLGDIHERPIFLWMSRKQLWKIMRKQNYDYSL